VPIVQNFKTYKRNSINKLESRLSILIEVIAPKVFAIYNLYHAGIWCTLQLMIHQNQTIIHIHK